MKFARRLMIVSLLTPLIILSIILSMQAYASVNETRETAYIVGKFLNSKPQKPDQIFKIQYDVINGTINEVNAAQHDGASSLLIKTASSGDSMLEIKFPRNYPYTNEPVTSDGNKFLVLINGLDTVVEYEKTDCFFVFSIPLTNSSVIELNTVDLLTNTPWHGDDVPAECASQTLVENTPTRKDGTIAPRQQFIVGVAAEDVVCKEGLYLIIKSSNDNPACVKLETKQILIERGWAKLV
jgi:hypothetical protein